MPLVIRMIHYQENTMELFIARQPIFTQYTQYKRLYAYELLYRGTKTPTPANTSGNKAKTSVLSSVFLIEGIEKIKLLSRYSKMSR